MADLVEAEATPVETSLPSRIQELVVSLRQEGVG